MKDRAELEELISVYALGALEGEELKEAIRLSDNRDDKVHARLMILDGGGIGKHEVEKLIDEIMGEFK